jgi:Spy/CpxP family protein refolding chaperone
MRKAYLIASLGLVFILCAGQAGLGQAPNPGEESSARGPAMAGRGFPGPMGGQRMAGGLRGMLDSGRLKAALNLTDQQVARLHTSLVDAEKAGLKTRADLATRRIELRELLRADKPDRDAVMKKVGEISDLQGQMMKEQVGVLLTAETVLTPEQRTKLRSFIQSRAAMRGRAGGWGQGWGARRPMRGMRGRGGGWGQGWGARRPMRGMSGRGGGWGQGWGPRRGTGAPQRKPAPSGPSGPSGPAAGAGEPPVR